jgi:hypothetical protein
MSWKQTLMFIRYDLINLEKKIKKKIKKYQHLMMERIEMK